jgi:prepilin-type N-terminal cleavage/methylation domain-containing protein
MSSIRPLSPQRNLHGFTLIELLVVITVIGVLTAIAVPVIGGAREKSRKTKTRVQFTQWAAGVRLFKQEYGYYPRFESSTASSKHKVNGSLAYNSAAFPDDAYLFREILSGKPSKPNGSAFEFGSAESALVTAQNRKRQEFLKFDISEITSRTGADAGDGEILVDGALKDALGNVEIVVIVDRNSDGFINTADLATGVANYPAVVAKGGKGTLSSATIEEQIKQADGSQKGVRAEVIFYSPGLGDKSASTNVNAKDAVWSW